MYELLADKAKRVRHDIIRATGAAGSGHPGGSLSATDLLVTLYFAHMRHDPENPKSPDRDRFVLSKGHAAPALYSTLAEAGYFDPNDLTGLRKLGNRLQGHPSTVVGLPGLEASTGSLGQGLSIGVGMALAGKLDCTDRNVYVLLGDGECQEGMVWEAAMAAGHYRLDKLVAILDRNRLQIDGSTDEVMSIEPLADKWRAFGWDVQEVDGHNFGQVLAALQRASGYVKTGWEQTGVECTSCSATGRPHMIIANTVKGRGVSFMENKCKWHGEAASGELLDCALEETKCS